MPSTKAGACTRLPIRGPCMSQKPTITVSMSAVRTAAPSSSCVSIPLGTDIRLPSGLVEELALEVARAILGRQLDIAGREQEDLVRDPLHATVERVGEARGEVDQPLAERA